MKFGRIPASASIVFHHANCIYVMNADGSGRTQITFDTSKVYEHVAVSPDRRYIVANYGQPLSKLVLYNLATGQTRLLVPNFYMAGNGGVDWDNAGFLYFAGIQALPYPTPTTPEEARANGGANDLWRIRPDGTGLTQLTNTPDRGEADVSVHPNGTLMTYNAANLTTGLMELWVKQLGGPGEGRVFVALDAEQTVHDPELSPDGQELIFSMRNPNFHNFPNDPHANTAQDIYRIRLDGTGLQRITEPGPISILPDWKGAEIIHMHMSDQTTPPWGGMITRTPEGTEIRRVSDVNMPKYIP